MLYANSMAYCFFRFFHLVEEFAIESFSDFHLDEDHLHSMSPQREFTFPIESLDLDLCKSYDFRRRQAL